MSKDRTRKKKKLDREFSRYIRRVDADGNGYVKCFTCGIEKHWKEVDAGHFRSRKRLSTRWDEKNVQPQCKKCNGFNAGEQYIFGKNLDVKYGEGTADDITAKSFKTKKWTIAELDSMIDKYKSRNKYLDGKIGK